MSLDSVITEDMMKKLKCDLCKNYLSHFPICSANDKNICGRLDLHPHSQENSFDNKVFETLAKFVKFPCQYEKEGCLEKCFPKDIPKHEKICDFRIIKCPTRHFFQCDWEGALPIALDHCLTKHNDLFLNDGNFELDLSESHKRENLLKCESSVFIVSQKFYSINKLMEINIRYPDYAFDIQDFPPCKITFKTNNRKVYVQLYAKTFQDDSVTEIFLDSLNDRNESSTIVKGKIVVEKNNEINPVLNDEKNEEFLTLLKCSSCSSYALPPIYEVTGLGTSTQNCVKCSKCIFKLQQDSVSPYGSGKPPIKLFRNYSLDNVANKLTFPCENQANGCTFKSKPQMMIKHHLFCSYGKYNCPIGEFINCNWKGFGIQISNHIRINHSNLILPSSIVSEKVNYHSPSAFSESNKTVEHKTKCYITKFSNIFFRLNFFIAKEEFHWVVQPIGPIDNNLSFNYEIEIINKEDKRFSLRTRQPCLNLMKPNDLLRDKYCYFRHNQIKNCIVNNSITFNVKIFD